MPCHWIGSVQVAINLSINGELIFLDVSLGEVAKMSLPMEKTVAIDLRNALDALIKSMNII